MNKEEKAALVKKYCNENTKPKQDLCPEVNQYIRTSKGYEIWNSKDLSREPINFDPTRWSDVRECGLNNVVCVRNEYEGLYIEYHEDMDTLEFAHIFMDGGRGKAGEAKEWYYGNGWNYSRYFIFRNDPNAYSNTGILTGNTHYSKDLLKEMKTWSRRSLVGEENYAEFKKFAPDSSELREYNHWYSTPLAQIWQYARWYQMEFIKRTSSKTFNDLSAYELDDITPLPSKSVVDDKKMIYFQKLDDKYAVLRVFRYGYRYEINSDKIIEEMRLFVSDKGKPTVMVNDGYWKIKASTPWAAQGAAVIINASDIQEWKPLKYIMPCIEDDINIQNFINYLRHPIVEQLSKAGYVNVAKKLMYCDEIASNMKTFFLVEKETKQPMFKLLGVNKFVLNAMECHDGNLKIAREIKYFVGGFDATELSQDVCDYIANYVDSGRYGSNSITTLVPGHRYEYWRRDSRYSTPLTDDEKKWILKLFKMESKQTGCISLFDDVISTYNRINNKPDIDLYNVKNYDDINRLHDALVALKVQEDRERQALRDASERERQELLKKKFEKLQDERIKKYEYEDGDFCIRVPHQLDEITKEGIVLNHCVGGYLDKHAQGITNILFLRRKADENIPFYTIEICDDHVIQIHGNHNRWLGNNPEAVPFVYKYLEQLGVRYDKKLLLNKGAGYSAGDEELPESYLQEAA